MKALLSEAPGGPEVLQIEDVQVGKPGRGEVRLRQTVVGVNFHDIYVRTGLYRTLPLPGIPGIAEFEASIGIRLLDRTTRRTGSCRIIRIAAWRRRLPSFRTAFTCCRRPRPRRTASSSSTTPRRTAASTPSARRGRT